MTHANLAAPRARPASASGLLHVFVALTLGLSLGAASVCAQSMPFALEVPGGHVLWQADEASLVAAPWDGLGSGIHTVQFLSVELPGYARADRLRADLARLEKAQGPAAHVRLPLLGSIYRAREGSTTHLLMLRSEGTIEVLLSVADNGPEPGILPDIAVSRSGTEALVATSLDAGGNAIVMDLMPGGGAIDLTLQQPPLDVSGTSMRLGPDTAWFLAEGTLYRATLGVAPPVGETATPVPLSLGPGDVLLDETTASQDGRALAVISEDLAGDRLIHFADTTGASRRLTAAAAAYDLPGYDSPVGPFLVLSVDGSQIAWRQTLLQKKEIFTRPTGLGGTLTEVTGDSQFTDTIDNVGVMGFKGPDILIFAAGEVDLIGIGSADIFRVDLSVSTVPANITGTSGQATPPFTQKGDLDITGVVSDPANTALLVEYDPNQADYGILRVPTDGVTPPAGVMTNLVAAPQVYPAGDGVLIFSEPELPTNPRHAHLLSAGGQLTQLASVPQASALILDRFVANRSGTAAAFVASVGPDMQLPGLVDLTGPSIAAAWPMITGVSPTIAFSPSGRVAVGVGPTGAGPFAWVGFTGVSTGVLYGPPVWEGFPLEN